MANSLIDKVLSTSKGGATRRGDRNGMSWEGQAMPFPPDSEFGLVVAPPTIVGKENSDFGVVPTEKEFIDATGREPDKYERPQMQGLRPFFDCTGAEIFDYKTGETVKTAGHLFIAPERRKEVLRRLPADERGLYLAVWTLLDVDQQIDMSAFRHLLTTDETLAEIAALDVDDRNLQAVGNFGVIQDGQVRIGRSIDAVLDKGVPLTEFFKSRKPAEAAVPAVSPEAAVSATAEKAKVNENKEDELKNPVQETPISYKISGSTMRRKCAYVKFNDAARHCLVACAAGHDSDEFDEGTELTLTVGDRTVKCEAGPSFDIPEAMVTCQVFKIKE
jgi:ribosomal protein L12E/L44/L45/RPP1/RPP2